MQPFLRLKREDRPQFGLILAPKPVPALFVTGHHRSVRNHPRGLAAKSQ